MLSEEELQAHADADELREIGEAVDEEETVELAEILYQYRAAILDLAGRVDALEARPQFAQAIGKKTRL